MIRRTSPQAFSTTWLDALGTVGRTWQVNVSKCWEVSWGVEDNSLLVFARCLIPSSRDARTNIWRLLFCSVVRYRSFKPPGFSACTKGFSVCMKGFSACTKGFSACTKGFSACTKEKFVLGLHETVFGPHEANTEPTRDKYGANTKTTRAKTGSNTMPTQSVSDVPSRCCGANT